MLSWMFLRDGKSLLVSHIRQSLCSRSVCLTDRLADNYPSVCPSVCLSDKDIGVPMAVSERTCPWPVVFFSHFFVIITNSGNKCLVWARQDRHPHYFSCSTWPSPENPRCTFDFFFFIYFFFFSPSSPFTQVLVSRNVSVPAKFVRSPGQGHHLRSLLKWYA